MRFNLSSGLFWWRVVLIVLAVFWVYAPALSGGWFWDDATLIPENADLRSWLGLGPIWSYKVDWPLTSTAFWIQWHLWGRLPFGYHLVNVALQLGNGLLVWILFHRLGLRWAWMGGLLFVVHPLGVESVAWVSELKNTLSLSFFILSFLAWMDQDEGGEGYLRSLLFYVLAMLCKTSVIMLPAILLLYTWWKHGVVTRRNLQKTLPFFAVALVLGLTTLHFQMHFSSEGADIPARGFLARCLEAGASICFYLGKFIWPFPLMPVYPRWSLESPSIAQLLALPLLVCVFFSLWIGRQGWCRHLLFGFGFFVLNLLPVIGLIDMTFLKFSWVADHFVYLPMIGLIGLAVLALETLSTRLSAIWRIPYLGTIAVIALLLAWNAHQYAGLFAKEEGMWAYNVALNPSAWVAHNNWGYVLLQSGRVNEAEKQFEIALLLNPVSPEAHNNRGVFFLQTGRYPESIEEFETALRLNPKYGSAQANLELARGKINPTASQKDLKVAP